jgi:hypothetical protein
MKSMITLLREEADNLKGITAWGQSVGARISPEGFANYLEQRF